jgi:hypothetical protein
MTPPTTKFSHVRTIYDICQQYPDRTIDDVSRQVQLNSTNVSRIMKTFKEKQRAKGLSKYTWMYCLLVYAESKLVEDEDKGKGNMKARAALHSYLRSEYRAGTTENPADMEGIHVDKAALCTLCAKLFSFQTLDAADKAITEAAENLLQQEALQERTEDANENDIPTYVFFPRTKK